MNPIDASVVLPVAEALAIGLLIGVERYKDRKPGEQKTAGVRTFAIICLLGAICSLLANPGFTLLTFGGVMVLLALGYFRRSANSYGLTTEVAGMLTFWLGYMTRDYEALAIGLGVLATILLAHKERLHEFAEHHISELEFYDTLKFLAVVFVIYPVLPDRPIGPFEFVNPSHLWLLVILVSSISYFGYVLVRVAGEDRGTTLGALLGGLVSTTAVTLSLADRSARFPGQSRRFGLAGVMANAVQFPRLLALVWIVSPALARHLALPLLAMGAVGMSGAWLLERSHRAVSPGANDLPLQNPYSLRAALKLGLFFAAVFLISRGGQALYGTGGILGAAAIAGLGDASAISLSLAGLTAEHSFSLHLAATGVLIAVTANALLKTGFSLVKGGREYAFWIGGGLATMLAVGWGWLLI